MDRNRLKRLIRESFRHRQNDLAGLDVVVMARPTAAAVESETLRESLGSLFKRAQMQSPTGQT